MESDSDEDQATKDDDKPEIPENIKSYGLFGDSSINPWLLSDGKEKDDEDKETIGGNYCSLKKNGETLRC